MAMDLNQNLYLFSLLWGFIFTLIALKLIRTRRSNNKSNSILIPPSPPKLPVIGNLHQLGKLPHRSLCHLSKTHGPIMLLQLGQTQTLVVSSADLAREMAKTNNNDIVFSDRPSNTASRILFYGLNNDLSFAAYGQEWRHRRKISVLELLSAKRVRSYHSIREEQVSEMVHKIRESCMKSTGSLVNVSELLVECSNNVISRCIFGHKCEGLNGKIDGKISFGEIIKKVMNHFGEFSFGDFFPSFWWIDVITGLVPRMKATFKELDAFMDQVIEEHKCKKINYENKDFVDILLQVQQDAHDDDFNLSLDTIKAMLLDLYAGGSETTSSTLEWAMTELVRNPRKMKKAQDEVRRIVGNNNKSRIKVEESDVNEMNYLKCVVKETLRLHNPPALITRFTNKSVKLGGYQIPPKTTVILNAWAIQRDDEQWERAEEFVPERFENNEVDFKGQNFEFIPFGFGRRGCPGLLFGVASIEYALCNLLYWFDWKLPYGVEDIDMSEVNGLTVSKKLPLLLQPIPY